MPTVTALVPIRHHSVRVPGKNYREFAGAPLFTWIVRTLLACPHIGQVVIDTDSPAVQDITRVQFPSVTLLDRPEHLRGDDVSMNDVLLHDMRALDGDLFLQTHSTNPLLRPETIAHALERFFAAYPAHDSLFAVTRLQARLWDSQARPINHDRHVLLRTQDLPPVYLENSCLYLFHREVLETRRNRIGERPMLHEIGRDEATDIDDELDFRMAELLFAGRDAAGRDIE